jgi:hypothetical protein
LNEILAEQIVLRVRAEMLKQIRKGLTVTVVDEYQQKS